MARFEYIPLEVLEVIASFLSVKDLSNCLNVSRAWYEIFNNDIFWKKRVLKLDDYLSTTKSLVEPSFTAPKNTTFSICQSRLQFLREQHLLQNWDLGHYKKEEIEFDCDESISYNIKVNFLGNNHICLHTTGETEVWNVAEEPFLVMTIPYCLKELWERNAYQVIENDLIVIQCNVVQVYKICLESKSWNLNFVFFYDKPEEFSSSITAETDVDGLFQLESFDSEDDFKNVICGKYLVGAVKGVEYHELHVWNIVSGKKLKEEKCQMFTLEKDMDLSAPTEATDKVLVTSHDIKAHKLLSIIYDLAESQFLLYTQSHQYRHMTYFGGSLSFVAAFPPEIIWHFCAAEKNMSSAKRTLLPELPDSIITCVRPLGKKLIVSNREELFLIDTSQGFKESLDIKSLLKVNFKLSHTEVLFNRYILLHSVRYDSIKEIWKANDCLQKIMDFPDDSGTYIARNSACTKIVLERGNKLFVLTFW